MNKTERKPILETLYKHGSSRLFLLAMSLTLLGAVIKCGYDIIISIIRLISANGENDLTGTLLTLISAVIALGFASLVFYGLFSTYRFFNEKSDGGLKIDFSVKFLGFSYLAECLFFAIELITVGGDDSVLTVGIIIFVALALLYFLFFKGLKLSAEYPEYALENSPRGRISGFIIAALITVLMIYLALVAVQLFLGIRAIFTPVAVEFEAERAKEISDTVWNLTKLFIFAPTMAGYAYYLKLIKLFRRDMNEAREEWAAIERKAKRSGL